MRLRFFAIPALDPAAAQQELNDFLLRQRVLRCERHFVADGGQSYWSFCVEWLEGAGPVATAAVKPGRGERVDYRELLSEEDFAVFARLRHLRKTLAEAAGVPLFAVFTNEQLAEVVIRKVDGLEALATIEGVGPSRVEKYGAAILRELQPAVNGA